MDVYEAMKNRRFFFLIHEFVCIWSCNFSRLYKNAQPTIVKQEKEKKSKSR